MIATRLEHVNFFNFSPKKSMILAAFALGCSHGTESVRTPDNSSTYQDKADVSIGGRGASSATLNWSYSVDLEKLKNLHISENPDLKPTMSWMLRRTVNWRVEDQDSGETLHDGSETHFFDLGKSTEYKRKGPLFNLWRSTAYSARGPVIDGVEQGPVLKRPRIRRGQQPTAEQVALIQSIDRSFSSLSTVGSVKYTDSFLLYDSAKFNASEANGFYAFPSRTRSGPWASADYPHGALVNLRRDYADFSKYHHSKLDSDSQESAAFDDLHLAESTVEVKWKTDDSVEKQDFKVSHDIQAQ